VVGPLLKLDGKDTYVVIDTLDECEGENDKRIILRLLAEAQSLKKVRLRMLITSRFQSDTVSARFLMLSTGTSSSMT
jgi:hypothetical protein